ncbi:uncharacterized protein SAPINGB_P001900 [Magnusiomyces paraingens]|uniref:Inosine/uridine-preferring nucleoside hydrolase domain-containing protein n=1 Tax=Magnusiomyces paraingens TaxID=2606893 RepID=A0A5E8BIZ9_9ASCO|nr:uncharacterized protein SAPINGB_P001900 [Saprochaete ingens]VVT48684.1 unnamed protein product [Saprochaete ingens]
MTVPETSTKIPLWIDCDPGHDDAIAMLLGSNLPEYFFLVGISTVHGNAPLKRTTNNALALLDAFLVDEAHGTVNVYAGAERPLERPPMGHAPSIHGESGLDGTSLLPSPTKQAQWPSANHSNPAVDALAEAVKQYPDTLAVVATGALTNIAAFVQKYPELIAPIRVLSVMGGAFAAGGNITPNAEFNIWCDPEAARIVLGSKYGSNALASKTILLTLDMTHQAIATREICEKVRGKNTSVSEKQYYVRQMLYELLVFFGKTYTREFGAEFARGPPVHDPLAVACVLPLYHVLGESAPEENTLPSLDVKYTRYALDIETKDPKLVGQTIKLGKDAAEGVYVIESMDIEAFWRLVLRSLDHLDARAHSLLKL